MKKKLTIGMVALAGLAASAMIGEAFASATFPLEVTVTNRLPFRAVFPEAKLSMRAVTAPDGATQTVTVTSLDKLKRLVSSMEQVAGLNNAEAAFILEADDGLEGEATEGEANTGESAVVASAADAPASESAESAESTAGAGKKSKKS